MSPSDKQDARPRPATRPEHSEAYWQTMKYVIIGLGALMVVAIALAVVVVLRIVPWS
jgi:hypothetical protein